MEDYVASLTSPFSVFWRTVWKRRRTWLFLQKRVLRSTSDNKDHDSFMLSTRVMYKSQVWSSGRAETKEETYNRLEAEGRII